MIVVYKTSISNVHDIKHFPFIIDDLGHYDINIKYMFADKGHDSENVHESISAQSGADAVIPVRNNREDFKGQKPRSPNGKYRKRMFRSFPDESYKRRCLIETDNSMIEHKMGDTVYGRTDHSRDIEIQCRYVAHNFRRLLDLGVI